MTKPAPVRQPGFCLICQPGSSDFRGASGYLAVFAIILQGFGTILATETALSWCSTRTDLHPVGRSFRTHLA